MEFGKSKSYKLSADHYIHSMAEKIARHGGCRTGAAMILHAMALAMRAIEEEEILTKARAAKIAEKTMEARHEG